MSPVTKRRSSGGGFRHDASDRGGPYLEDTVSMGQAFLGLYRSSGERRWLKDARAAMAFTAANFSDAAGGYISAPVPHGAHGVFRKPVRAIDQNAAVVRLANRLRWYTGDAHYQALARHGMKYLIVAGAAAPEELHAELLLADEELAVPPIHITVVGAKSDPAAQSLHASALKYPAGGIDISRGNKRIGDLTITARHPGHELQDAKRT
jgi:uncharacterized protein YyaL (SSP411 family)